MNVPGFYAEASLVSTKGNYRSNAGLGNVGMVEKAQVILAIPPAKSCITTYGAYISHWFPAIMCEPINTNPVLSPFRAMTGVHSRIPEVAFEPRTTVLNPSSPEAGGVGGVQNCRVVALPFIGQAKTFETCDGLKFSTLEVLNHPELDLSWDGGIADIPNTYYSHWFTFEGQYCNCCPGMKCSDSTNSAPA